MLTNKTVILGVTGSIAAYKTAYIASGLKKQHCDVHVLMTQNATHFINPITFETLTGNKCVNDTFDRNFEFQVNHVSLAKRADAILIAPASANVIAKLAHGIADDMLTTTALACKCPKIVAPAMNTNMYENPIVQENIQKLKELGYIVVEPAVGYLACGDTGAGKMPDPDILLQYLYQQIAWEKDMTGLRVLVSAGATQEAIDPVRYITNHSTGKMGYAIAENAMHRGASVTLVTGPTAITPPLFAEVVPVTSAKEMLEAIASRQRNRILSSRLCRADYCPAAVSEQKIKKTEGNTQSPLIRLTIFSKFRRASNRRAVPMRFLHGKRKTCWKIPERN